MEIRWPPPPLGLGTPLSLALASTETRTLLKRSCWLVPLLGLATPFVMLGIDQLFFEGVSLERVRDLGSQPLGFRVLVVLYSGVTEELLYRLLVATFVARLAHVALSRFTGEAKTLAQWLGILVAAFLFGLAPAGNLPDVGHPVLRAVTVNGAAGLVLGWLYWWRGIEAAIVTHMVAIVVLHIVVPLFC